MSPAAVNIILLHRVNAYIKNGWDKQLVDPDHQQRQPAERIAPYTPDQRMAGSKCMPPVMKSSDSPIPILSGTSSPEQLLMDYQQETSSLWTPLH